MINRILLPETLAIVSAILVYPGLNAAEKKTEIADLIGPQLWSKVISYHDPNGIWDKFQGKVQLVTTFNKKTLHGVIIELDNAEDFYQSQNGGEFGYIMGTSKGKPFTSAKTDFKQANENALYFKQHHTGHVGMPMEMKVAGLVAENAVKLVEFQGRDCYALSLIGKPNKVTHEYWKGSLTLYVDPETFAMKGVLFTMGGVLQESPDNPSQYFECLGEFEVGGIKIPRVKNFYLSKDGSHLFTDVYSNAK